MNDASSKSEQIPLISASKIHLSNMEASQETPTLEAPAPSRTLPWTQIAWFGALLILLFFPVLRVMVIEWNDDPSMGHGFFVPVIAGYLVWQKREKLAALPAKPHWVGFVLIVLGFVALILGTVGADFFIMRMGFLSTLYGIVLATCGWTIFKALSFPMFLLLFMIRIPLFIYSQITFPLQIFASQVAEITLGFLGIPVLREGNILELASQRLSVVEACSGIRSLLSLTFLSLVYGYFFEKRTWMRVLLFVSTIPIAILANAARVTLTGILSEINKAWSEGIYHSLEGWVIFMVALVILLVMHRIFNLTAKVMGLQNG